MTLAGIRQQSGTHGLPAEIRSVFRGISPNSVIQVCCDPRRRMCWSFGSETIIMHKASKIDEHYGRFEEDDRSWDIAFWQRRGGAEIFLAAWEMILDHRLLTQGDATEPRLQRTVEHFGKA
jgi:hypothetical protein